MVSPPDAPKSASVPGTTQSIPARSDPQAAPGGTPAVPAADHIDIRPLETAGALQILISEVRAELDAVLLAMGATSMAQPEVRPDHPQAAVHVLLESLLQAYLQEPQDFAAFEQTASRIDAAWQSGTARALEFISAWKSVPVPVMESVQRAIAGADALLNEDSVNPLWLRAEWAGLAPRLERYRRRRRRLRRWLTDPDFKSAPLDQDTEEPR